MTMRANRGRKYNVAEILMFLSYAGKPREVAITVLCRQSFAASIHMLLDNQLKLSSMYFSYIHPAPVCKDVKRVEDWRIRYYYKPYNDSTQTCSISPAGSGGGGILACGKKKNRGNTFHLFGVQAGEN